ncbi:39S ribosomal protein L30, mitochondrial [Chiloscyllium plagiosum]|uniref:39S ribosomal protein L30, mitochondrial n=1 Tax=Chiloscyllium plagiosum TaxID=36176 RepID=UPI001CB7BDC9|nr:39S ribosomal protein L30, mitochondrial [Chiloscyllium plagiosum]
MTALCRNVNRLTNLMEQVLVPLSWAGFVRLKFTKARIPAKMFEVSPSDHARYNGNPDCPHQLHIITRIKCTKRRPYWEKKIVHDLGLDKSHQPRIHKNVPSINNKLKVIKHLIRVQPLKLPQGLPTEQELADSYLKSTGELIIRRHLQPLE